MRTRRSVVPWIAAFLLSSCTCSGPGGGIYNVAFVTSGVVIPGELGGLQGADAFCQSSAQSAGLPGTYVAWLSSASVDARDRIPGTARGWVRTDGRAFADTIAALADAGPYHLLTLDERGHEVDTNDGGLSFNESEYVMTGTTTEGRYEPDGDCAGYTDGGFPGSVQGGLVHLGMPYWTNSYRISTGCSNRTRLYCLQIDRSAPLPPPSATGRLAFVSSNRYFAGGGLAGMDQHCVDEAADAGLTGTFKAMLTATGTTLADRFDVNGPPWRRLDGVQLSETAAQFLDPSKDVILAPLQITANGTTVSDGDPNYDTHLTWNREGCNDWTSSAAAAARGICSSTSSFRWNINLSGALSTCYYSARLYCLQE